MTYPRTSEEWDKLIGFITNHLKIDPLIITYIAISPIIKLLASGLSNIAIAHKLDMDLAYVDRVVHEFSPIGEWPETLGIDAYHQYLRCNGDRNAFFTIFWSFTEYRDDVIEKAFVLCEFYVHLMVEMENYYESA